MEALWHRGPDEDGLLVAPSAALGMRRLSIIDLPGGHQPVFNETGNVAVVFNGEIYNFRQLRKTLEGRGHAFRTHSDTEVIVHAYEEWGEQCLRELRGMFAFAIWDARSSRHVREMRRGAREFSLRATGWESSRCITRLRTALFLFASEVRALIASGRIAPRVSPDSLEAYLLFGSVAEPSTLVEGVFLASARPLPYVLGGRSAGRSRQPKPYWDFSDAALQRKGRSRKRFRKRQSSCARCSRKLFATT